MLLLQFDPNKFDPTDYGQENYRQNLRDYYDAGVEKMKTLVPEPMWDKQRNPFDVMYEEYSQGFKDYERDQKIAPAEYDPSIDATKNLGWMEGVLKEMSSGAESVANKFRTRATTDVNKSFDRSQEGMDERFAQTGLGKSGIGSVADVNLAEGRADAISDVDLRADQIEQDVNFRVISQLLGIDSMRLNAGQFDTQVAQNEDQFSKGLWTNWEQFDEQMAFNRERFEWEQEQAEWDFWRDLATPLLTGGATGFAGRASNTNNYFI